jgi:3-oxoadipate CoA-transferase, alpha subunit
VPINKIMSSVEEAVDGVQSGDTLLVSGFGEAGSPEALLDALATRPLKDLVVVSNNAGYGQVGLAALIKSGAVRKLVCSYPKPPGSELFGELYLAGEIELELVPQGTLSERIRAAGAGIGGFFTRTGADTLLAEGKERRIISDEEYVLEQPLHADFAFIRAWKADRWGNVVYRKTSRNFGPAMAMAARTTAIEVQEIVQLGELDPESIVTPGIFVNRVVEVRR